MEESEVSTYENASTAPKKRKTGYVLGAPPVFPAPAAAAVAAAAAVDPAPGGIPPGMPMAVLLEAEGPAAAAPPVPAAESEGDEGSSPNPKRPSEDDDGGDPREENRPPGRLAKGEVECRKAWQSSSPSSSSEYAISIWALRRAGTKRSP